MFVTIDRKKEIGDEPSQYLRHESAFGSCNKVIDFEVAFPPTEEYFNVPSELIDGCDFLSREVVSVGGNPVYFVIDAITNNAQFFFRLVDSGSAEQYYGIVKNDAAYYDFLIMSYLGIKDNYRIIAELRSILHYNI